METNNHLKIMKQKVKMDLSTAHNKTRATQQEDRSKQECQIHNGRASTLEADECPLAQGHIDALLRLQIIPKN